MADRFFSNEMPDFIPEGAPLSAAETSHKDSLTHLLHLPYNSLSEKLKQQVLDIKETVVNETWIKKGKLVRDYSVYTGALGTALLLFKAYQVTNNNNDLALCSQIIRACDDASRGSGLVTFICGEAGVCSLGAVVAKHSGNDPLCDYYLTRFKEVVVLNKKLIFAAVLLSYLPACCVQFGMQIKLPNDLPDEVLYGRAGFLWACSFLNKNIGRGTISSTRMKAVVDKIIMSGRQLANGRCPLMYEWHGKKYMGAAHGLAGIMNVLLDMELKPDELEDIMGTLRYMIRNRFPSGNYPSSEGNESDRLVHWCHGAPGVSLTLTKAAKVFGSEEFLQAAIDASEVVWTRGLLKRVGICHGVSGNAYVFLSLYRLTGKVEFLYKAKAFASFLHDRASILISEGIMHGGDRPYSLFEGVGGMAYLFLDMTEPSEASFPAYEL